MTVQVALTADVRWLNRSGWTEGRSGLTWFTWT